MLTSFSNGSSAEGRAPIEIHLNPVATRDGAPTVVRLCGEHDLATVADLHRALGSVEGSVLVDLTDCAFIDSTVIRALIIEAHTRELDGSTLELLVPPENTTIMRTLTVAGVGGLLAVRSPER
jgi:anti-anti-sigma regulatory factor